jgi:HEAT repeat protein
MTMRWTYALAALACLHLEGRAGGFDATNASFEDLAFHAVRYATTPEKLQAKQQATAELFARRAEALRFLMSRIHFENVGVQVLAQNLVEMLRKEEAVPVLLDFVDDGRTNTQKSAVYFLGFYTAPDAAGRIRPLLARDKLRGVTIRTLGKWKVADAVPEIAQFLKDDEERVRVAAANALRDIGDPRAIPHLIEAQGDPVFTVRNTALRALVSFGPAAEKPMLAALEKAEGPARRQLVRGLGELRSRAAEKPLARLRRTADAALREDLERSLLMIRMSQ